MLVLVPPPLHHDRARHRSKPATTTIAAAEPVSLAVARGTQNSPGTDGSNRESGAEKPIYYIDSQVRDEYAEEEAEKAEDQYPAREQPPVRGRAAVLGLHLPPLRSFRVSPLLRRVVSIPGWLEDSCFAFRESHHRRARGGRLYAGST